VTRTTLYRRATIVFQAEHVDGGWLPRCTIFYDLKGRKTEHIIKTQTPRPTEQEADDTIFGIARAWIEEHDDQMTSIWWSTPIDEASRAMWRELEAC
jgi:hypothetical protein